MDTGGDDGGGSAALAVDHETGSPSLAARSPFAVWGAVCLGTVVAAVVLVSSTLLHAEDGVGLGAAVQTVLVALVMVALCCFLPAAVGLLLVTVLDAARLPRGTPPTLVVVVAAVVVAAISAPLYELALPFTVVPVIVGSALGLGVLRWRSGWVRAVLVGLTVAVTWVVGRLLPIVWF